MPVLLPLRRMLFIGTIALIAIVCAAVYYQSNMQTSDPASNLKWKNILTAEQYYVTREAGTERAFSGELWDEKRPGTYYDVTGEQALFRSEDKFESGTGWPSFTKPIDTKAISEKTDFKIGYPRTEIRSSQHGHHLGHVFKDGPEPTGLRYCINSAALTFVPDEEN